MSSYTDQSSEEIDEGIVTDQSAGAQQYRYNQGKRLRIYKRGYRNLTDTERTNFLTFVAAALGATFQFTDFNAAVHTVTFAEYNFKYQPREGVLWDWDIMLREEL